MIAAAREIAASAVSAMLRQLSFGIWRHRKIICDKQLKTRSPFLRVLDAKSRLYIHKDHEKIIYTIRKYQNLPFF